MQRKKRVLRMEAWRTFPLKRLAEESGVNEEAEEELSTNAY